jgi:DNA-binding response OmpR family regulator
VPSLDVDQILNETRDRFVRAFVARCSTLDSLIDETASSGPGEPIVALTQASHRLSGLGGTIGFPTVSARASDLEALLRALEGGAFDAARAHGIVEAIRAAFSLDLATPPAWIRPPIAASPGGKILVAEDESDQRAIVTAYLEGAGYLPIPVVSGDLVVGTARAERPALILLDIAMPRLDGYSACRLLKADPELAGIPVIFMTTGANLDDRLAGLTLGADEFLSKPIDMRELVLRIGLLIDRTQPRAAPIVPAPSASSELTFDGFVAAAKAELGRSPAALAIVRLPAARHDQGSRLLAQELRGRDVIGAYGPTRLLVLMPQMTAAAARDRLEPLIDRLNAQGDGTCAGVSATSGSPAGALDSAAGAPRTVEALIGEADEALAEARYLGHRIAIWTARPERPERRDARAAARTVVVAEDDPDVTRIVDAQLRGAGYKTTLAFDGKEALAAVQAHPPDVLILDLMMPKLNGFDVLTRIREGPEPWPRTIVLSGRGREQDVMRAFELGADDYMTKPFNPRELMARIARLLK